ncbi:MAG: hypothetical protein O6705_02405, partial [Actinobacteria bacterium]|nr:hypothetical protein [Actinomycetota bacterium]
LDAVEAVNEIAGDEPTFVIDVELEQLECDADATCPAVIYEMHLCGAMTRSVPPQCVGDFFYLRGIDSATIEFQEAPDGTGWSAPVVVTGRKQGEAFIGETLEGA